MHNAAQLSISLTCVANSLEQHAAAELRLHCAHVQRLGGEQHHVQTMLHFHVGGWQPLAAALGVKAATIGKVLRDGRDVTAQSGAPVVASGERLTDVSIDNLLAGGASVAANVPPLWAATPTRRIKVTFYPRQ